MRSYFRDLASSIKDLIIAEEALGLNPVPMFAINSRWTFLTDPAKVEAFRNWLQDQLDAGILHKDPISGDYWVTPHVRKAYQKGIDRSYGDKRKVLRASTPDLFGVAKTEFLRAFSSSSQVATTLELLATRAYDSIVGVTSKMSTKMGRVLVDSLIKGRTTNQIARDLVIELGIGQKEALRVARTEIVYAQAMGQLDALEALGDTHVSAIVEWTTTSGNPCPRCSSMEGVQLTIKEARGVIPLHPNCQCAWASVDEDSVRKRRKSVLQRAILSQASKRGSKK